jgi:FtsH-binding integral membrane protein
MGASLTNIFLVYTGQSITQVFFITAGTFAATSLYGYTTRADLTKMGSFMMMGLFGIIIAGLVNVFVQSSALQLGISIVGVLVFVGLTAFDTQRIKSEYVNYAYAEGMDQAAKRSVYDSLTLLLNFINLFMMLLSLLGNRNSNN